MSDLNEVVLGELERQTPLHLPPSAAVVRRIAPPYIPAAPTTYPGPIPGGNLNIYLHNSFLLTSLFFQMLFHLFDVEKRRICRCIHLAQFVPHLLNWCASYARRAIALNLVKAGIGPLIAAIAFHHRKLKQIIAMFCLKLNSFSFQVFWKWPSLS